MLDPARALTQPLQVFQINQDPIDLEPTHPVPSAVHDLIYKRRRDFGPSKPDAGRSESGAVVGQGSQIGGRGDKGSEGRVEVGLGTVGETGVGAFERSEERDGLGEAKSPEEGRGDPYGFEREVLQERGMAQEGK